MRRTCNGHGTMLPPHPLYEDFMRRRPPVKRRYTPLRYPSCETLERSSNTAKTFEEICTQEERNQQQYQLKRRAKLGYPPVAQNTPLNISAGAGSVAETASMRPIEELIQNGPEKHSGVVVNLPPSCSVEGETNGEDMMGILKTLEVNCFTLCGGEDAEHIEYTPDEDRCNSVLMNMEGQALEHVENEAIDVHSIALQTCADLTECVRIIEDELSIVTKDQAAAHQVNTSIIAIMRIAENKKETSEGTLEELQQNASIQTLAITPLSEVECEDKEELHDNGAPGSVLETTLSRQLKRKPSSLSEHSLCVPLKDNENTADQQNWSNYLASQQRKLKQALLIKLKLYVDILDTVSEIHCKRANKQLLQKVEGFLSSLVVYEAAQGTNAMSENIAFADVYEDVINAPPFDSVLSEQMRELGASAEMFEDTMGCTPLDTVVCQQFKEFEAVENTASGEEIVQNDSSINLSREAGQDTAPVFEIVQGTTYTTTYLEKEAGQDFSLVAVNTNTIQHATATCLDSEAASKIFLDDTGSAVIQDTIESEGAQDTGSVCAENKVILDTATTEIGREAAWDSGYGENRVIQNAATEGDDVQNTLSTDANGIVGQDKMKFIVDDQAALDTVGVGTITDFDMKSECVHKSMCDPEFGPSQEIKEVEDTAAADLDSITTQELESGDEMVQNTLVTYMYPENQAVQGALLHNAEKVIYVQDSATVDPNCDAANDTVVTRTSQSQDTTIECNAIHVITTADAENKSITVVASQNQKTTTGTCSSENEAVQITTTADSESSVVPDASLDANSELELHVYSTESDAIQVTTMTDQESIDIHGIAAATPDILDETALTDQLREVMHVSATVDLENQAFLDTIVASDDTVSDVHVHVDQNTTTANPDRKANTTESEIKLVQVTSVHVDTVTNTVQFTATADDESSAVSNVSPGATSDMDQDTTESKTLQVTSISNLHVDSTSTQGTAVTTPLTMIIGDHDTVTHTDSEAVHIATSVTPKQDTAVASVNSVRDVDQNKTAANTEKEANTAADQQGDQGVPALDNDTTLADSLQDTTTAFVDVKSQVDEGSLAANPVSAAIHNTATNNPENKDVQDATLVSAYVENVKESETAGSKSKAINFTTTYEQETTVASPAEVDQDNNITDLSKTVLANITPAEAEVQHTQVTSVEVDIMDSESKAVEGTAETDSEIGVIRDTAGLSTDVENEIDQGTTANMDSKVAPQTVTGDAKAENIKLTCSPEGAGSAKQERVQDTTNVDLDCKMVQDTCTCTSLVADGIFGITTGNEIHVAPHSAAGIVQDTTVNQLTDTVSCDVESEVPRDPTRENKHCEAVQCTTKDIKTDNKSTREAPVPAPTRVRSEERAAACINGTDKPRRMSLV